MLAVLGPAADPLMPFERSMRSLALVLLGSALAGVVVVAAPFPAHLVVHGAHHHGGHHAWQEFPVALHRASNSTPFKPILPGTDHGLYNEGFFEGDIQRSKDEAAKDPDTKNAVTDPNLLWPSATLVYKVDDDVGCPESPQCAILMAAIDHYHEQTCIRFKQWTGEDNWVTIFFNSDSGACWSPVGRVGDGEQRLSLGQRCWYKGIVIHELGHAIGFWHEMNRPDRDDWIYVYWQNIIPGFASAFKKHQQVATLGEHFDYRSIMMYDEYAFSKDGRSPTLQATTGEEIGPIWMKKGLSASDKRRIEKLYRCDMKKPKPGFPYDVNCDFNRHVCGFKNGGSSNWNWRTVNQTDGYVYTSFDTAGTKPGHFMSINFPPISGDLESVRGELGCVRFYYLIETDGQAQIVLDQAYLKKVTQLNHDESTTFELWSNDTSSNEWIHMEIPLYVTRPFKLIFTSTFNGSATHGTIALDDVELLYTPCSPTPDAPSSTTGQPVLANPKPTTSTTSTTTTTTTTAPPEDSMVTEDSSATSASTSSSTESPTTDGGGTTIPSTDTTTASSIGPLMSTVESEQAIQQMQLQQQQTILEAQQLMEQQQQKEQQALLLAMAQNLQQHVDKHKKPKKPPHRHTEVTEATEVTETPDMASTTFPTYQTVATGGDKDKPAQDTFPITLTESFDSSQKVPNLPDPTDRIPLKNPNMKPTTTTPTPTTASYDVDESLP
ncbi:meprin A subunit beta-like isoform X2 [Thrips palmi]|uniref:Metalloendopeptidase n=1 Tax=Thrips palmi TaxID=161013 RepID=A0A6P8Z9H6_THRPL|nr:meprin A subunit beta-like isoform X2 [Thrips palmi]